MVKNDWQGIDVKVSGLDILEDVRRQFFFVPQHMEKAAVRAMNHALKAVRAEGVRAAREKYTAKARDVRAATRIKRATARSIEGHVIFSGKVGIPIAGFVTRPGRMPDWKGIDPRKRRPEQGVQVQIVRGGPFWTLTGDDQEKSFFAHGKGRMHVWWRKRGAKWEKGGKNWNHHIKPMFGPSPIQALTSEQTRARLAEYGQEDFRKQLINQIEQLFRGGKA